MGSVLESRRDITPRGLRQDRQKKQFEDENTHYFFIMRRHNNHSFQWTLAFAYSLVTACQPLLRPSKETDGTCGTDIMPTFVIGVVNILTNAFMVLLPLPLLISRRQNLSLRYKFHVIAALAIGV